MKRKQIITMIVFSAIVSFMLILENGIQDIGLGIITFLIVLCMVVLTYK